METSPQISSEVLARYAADAAREVEGVAGVANGGLHRSKAVAISGEGESFTVRLHVELEWGRNAAAVGADVQRRVGEYLERMAEVRTASIDVVVDGVGPPPARR